MITRGANKKNASPKNKGFRNLLKNSKERRLPLLAIVVVAVVIVVVAISVAGKPSARAESYKETSGAAGLQTTIDYDCTSFCEQKFNFNVYILNDDGQQVGVFRPDKDGKVQLALNEGRYIMLIGKQLGKDKLFPQEPLELKNGQSLELKLHY